MARVTARSGANCQRVGGRADCWFSTLPPVRASRTGARVRVPAAIAYTGSVSRTPGTPFTILGSIQLVVAALSFAFLLVTPRGTVLWWADVATTAFMAALGIFTLTIARRTYYAWGLGASLTIFELTALAGLMAVHDAEGQLTVALGLVLMGAFAGYFRPRPWLFAHVLLLSGGFLLVQVWNPHLSSWVQAFVVATVIAAVTGMVSSLAEGLRQQALHDSLTGALNRRGLEVLADAVAATAGRSDAPVAVALLDLDDFKGFNDSNGHVAGDVLLASLATAWRSELRATDLFARYGGDEFALVLPGSTPEDVLEIAERVRRRTEIAWSIGVTQWHAREDLYSALTRADSRLFEAKRARLQDPEI